MINEGIATNSPAIVVPRAVASPSISIEFPAFPELICENATRIPQTVPKSPKNGAKLIVVAGIKLFLCKSARYFGITAPKRVSKDEISSGANTGPRSAQSID